MEAEVADLDFVLYTQKGTRAGGYDELVLVPEQASQRAEQGPAFDDRQAVLGKAVEIGDTLLGHEEEDAEPSQVQSGRAWDEHQDEALRHEGTEENDCLIEPVFHMGETPATDAHRLGFVE